MALDLGTLVTAVELVQKIIALYQRIDSLPQQMTQLGRRMERLNIFLVRLESFVKKNNTKQPALAPGPLFSGQVEDLGKLLEGIKGNAAKVYDLFDRYEKGILSRSMNIEFRAKWMSQVWFSLVDSSPDKVQAIMEEIDYERGILSDYLGLMAIDKAHEESPGPSSPRSGRKAEKTGGNASGAVMKRPSPSPSRSPAPPRRSCKILFVDPYNEGRSVAAEALVKLLGQLTLKGHGDWRIADVCSAGFFAKNKGDCVDVIDGLDYSRRTFKLPWKPGAQSPSRMAMAAVFDNKWSDYPFKQDIRAEMTARTSCGMRKDMFTRFDFIFVFALREHDNMVKLREAVRKRVEAEGRVLARGKGRVLQLGAYLSRRKGAVREILNPPVTKDGKKNRENWNWKVSEIKTALKAFLKREMDWEQPNDKGTAMGKKTLEVGKA
ncbi:hypothetical protein C8A05DRAFT_12229 [Staphylotrichum tortipilum]|uniref:Uncharacterized protein n=1 Tax=Staphylotrichum tortipilum TaxID=2831512 RepID=A0AAN6RXP5_9PEZI|nr:hypothetical protein C8A05DRAFT_12229 [Staphylotrichum longicolle]